MCSLDLDSLLSKQSTLLRWRVCCKKVMKTKPCWDRPPTLTDYTGGLPCIYRITDLTALDPYGDQNFESGPGRVCVRARARATRVRAHALGPSVKDSSNRVLTLTYLLPFCQLIACVMCASDAKPEYHRREGRLTERRSTAGDARSTRLTASSTALSIDQLGKSFCDRFQGEVPPRLTIHS